MLKMINFEGSSIRIILFLPFTFGSDRTFVFILTLDT